MSYSIRPITGDDLPLLKDIRLKALKTDLDAYGATYAAEVNMSQEEWFEWLNLHKGDIFVLLEDEQVVGAGGIIIHKTDSVKKQIVVRCFFCDPSIHFHGPFKMLLKAAEDLAHKNPDVDKLLSSHRASDAAMKSVLQKAMFDPTHQVQKVWPEGKVEDEHHYELHLTHVAELSL